MSAALSAWKIENSALQNQRKNGRVVPEEENVRVP